LTFCLYPSGRESRIMYSLARISAGGTVIEGVSAEYGFPEELNPLGPYYLIMYRQK
jgi:hypothetical protein